MREKKSEVDERASYLDSTKLLLAEIGSMRGQMSKCLSVHEEFKDLGSRVAALEGRQRNNFTSTKSRADSALANSSPKNENWRKLEQTPRKSRRCTGKRAWCNDAVSNEGWMGQSVDSS